MQEFFIKMLMSIIMSMFPADKMKEAVAKFRTELEKKIAESPDQWDDVLWAGFLNAGNDVEVLADFILDVLENAIDASGTKLDDAIGEPILKRIREVFGIEDNDV